MPTNSKKYSRKYYKTHKKEISQSTNKWRENNPETVKKWVNNRTKERKAYFVSIKGGKCARCNGVFPNVCFDFHHNINGDKTLVNFGWANLSIKRLKEEVNKCIMVCANCHRQIHYK